jgi:hypothetical protein
MRRRRALMRAPGRGLTVTTDLLSLKRSGPTDAPHAGTACRVSMIAANHSTGCLLGA